jgi:menaquinone-dependent protoporphyrinogen oxidase
MVIQILYSSSEGQARRIAESVAQGLTDHGHTVQCEDVTRAVMRVKPNAVILIASIHVGRHTQAAKDIIRKNVELFNRIPAAFISVSLSARDADRTTARGYIEDFLAETGWHPALTATIAGALRYSSYGFLKKLIIKRIAEQNGLPTDTSRDHEFTDWQEVSAFADAFEQRLCEVVPG